MLVLYLAVLIISGYWVVKILAPEMAKPPLRRISKAVLEPNPQPNPVYFSPSIGPDQRIEKLESLLAEKNRNISILQKELRIFHAQVQSFDTVKMLLDDEIHHLREQNRIFRSELGLPSIVSPRANKPDLEKSIT